jgi:hypothetical protein
VANGGPEAPRAGAILKEARWQRAQARGLDWAARARAHDDGYGAYQKAISY